MFSAAKANKKGKALMNVIPQWLIHSYPTISLIKYNPKEKYYRTLLFLKPSVIF